MELMKTILFSGAEEIINRIRYRIRPFILLAVVFVLASAGCQQRSVKRADLAPPSGADLFKMKCSKCHDPERALEKYRSEEVWFETINRMKEVHKADINREEIDRLVKYHIDRQQQEAAVFNEKCQKCHPGKIFLEQNLTPEQARAIIKRMQQKAGNSIEDKDIEIIVSYHVRAQKTATDKALRAVLGQDFSEDPSQKKEKELFVEKCSACHSAARALSVFKDPEIWALTVKRMQHYSKGEITDLEARKLVDFHIERQQHEINTFQETCTQCHDDERINSRSMSEDKWLETIRRMQKKAPELITDEKVNLLAAYFHRRELTLAKIFFGRCHLCHYFSSGKVIAQGATQRLDGLIATAENEFGQSLEISDVNNLLSIHVQRQQRVMQLFENNCATCHPGRITVNRESTGDEMGMPTRADWISYIAALRGEELSRENQITINSQIKFHISNH